MMGLECQQYSQVFFEVRDLNAGQPDQPLVGRLPATFTRAASVGCRPLAVDILARAATCGFGSMNRLNAMKCGDINCPCLLRKDVVKRPLANVFQLPTLISGEARDTSALYTSGDISVAAVPEPESYAMMLAGFVLIGFAGRRERNISVKGRIHCRL